MNKLIQQEISDHIELVSNLSSIIDDISQAASLIVNSLNEGGKLLLFGNGGSAADAQHIATEIVCRYKRNRKALPAIALTTDTSALTAISNDFSYNNVFSRQVEALCNKNDVLIGISTSGNSQNVILGLNAAKKNGAKTIALTGLNSKKMENICDTIINVPSSDTARIQEIHILIGHCICQIIDEKSLEKL